MMHDIGSRPARSEVSSMKLAGYDAVVTQTDVKLEKDEELKYVGQPLCCMGMMAIMAITAIAG
jgi:hypothetical protein